MLQDYEIELIEKSFDGSINAEERDQLKANLDTSAKFKAEYEAYSKLFRGLKGMEIDSLTNELINIQEPSISDEQIENFLAGKLSSEESSNFQSQLAEDPNLFQHTEETKKTLRGLKQMELEDFQSEVTQWEDEAKVSEAAPEGLSASDNKTDEPQQRVKTKIRRLYFAVASAAAVGLFLFIGYRSIQNNYNNVQLASLAYEEPIYTGLRSDEENNKARDGLALMKNKQWKDAEQLLTSVKRGKYFGTAQLYLAHLYHQQNKYKRSSDVLEGQLDAREREIAQDAQWLYILNGMQNNDWSEKHQEILASISSNAKNPYHQKAKDLSKKLNSFWYKLAN